MIQPFGASNKVLASVDDSTLVLPSQHPAKVSLVSSGVAAHLSVGHLLPFGSNDLPSVPDEVMAVLSRRPLKTPQT